MEPSHQGTSRRNYSLISYILAALVGSLIGVIVMVTVLPETIKSRVLGPADVPEASVSNAQDLPAEQSAPAPVFLPPSDPIGYSRRTAVVSAVERVGPSVVSIVATQVVRQRGYARLFDDPFFGGMMVPRIYSREVPNTGSGVIIDEAGYIVTNAHVVRRAKRIRVVLTDGRALDSKVIGLNVISDLAVLKVEENDLPAAALGVSNDVMVGEWAIAIGNPLGLAIEDAQPAVTVGVVSAVGRDFPRSGSESRTVYRDMIQTDASINPGNSGGPLVNSLGQVIGVNTFILSQGGGLGMGFAVPIKRALEAAHQLIDQGSRDFWTGLDIHSVNTHIARTLGLSTARGALITVIEPLSPGESAGLLQGDVIVMANNQRVDSADDLIGAFRNAVVGDTIALKILRGRVFRGRGGGFFDTNLILEQDPRSEE